MSDDDPRIKRLSISERRQEEARDLTTSKDTLPYNEFGKAVLTNAGEVLRFLRAL